MKRFALLFLFALSSPVLAATGPQQSDLSYKPVPPMDAGYKPVPPFAG